MDRLDADIIDILEKNARTPFSQIAKRLKVGMDTVFRRYTKLLKFGIIAEPTLTLDSRMLGYEGIIDFLIKLRPGANPENVREQLEKIPNIALSAKTFGDIDLYTSFFFRNFSQIVKITDKIKQIKEVMSAEPLMYAAEDWTLPVIAQSNQLKETTQEKSIISSLFSDNIEESTSLPKTTKRLVHGKNNDGGKSEG